jgi:hypothetical protein
MTGAQRTGRAAGLFWVVPFADIHLHPFSLDSLRPLTHERKEHNMAMLIITAMLIIVALLDEDLNAATSAKSSHGV